MLWVPFIFMSANVCTVHMAYLYDDPTPQSIILKNPLLIGNYPELVLFHDPNLLELRFASPFFLCILIVIFFFIDLEARIVQS